MRDDHDDEQPAANPALPRAAYSIREFLAMHQFSRSKLHDLWKRGEGPQRLKVGRRTLITAEAAAEWRARASQQ